MATSYTPRLGLPEMADGEQSGYVTFNELGRMLDGILNVAVESATTTTPPASPVDGDLWYVPLGATGAWAGNEEKVAQWYNAQWYYYDTEGMVIYVKDSGTFLTVAQPDASATMALSGVAATNINITTTAAGLDVADQAFASATSPIPTTWDMTQSQFTINDGNAAFFVFASAQASIDGPAAVDTYFAGIYVNGVLESHARAAFSTTNQFGSGGVAIINSPISVQSGDVVELRFWTAGATRTVIFQSFAFTLLDL